MLGDGTEVLTDSTDSEMFDYDEGDSEALDKDATVPTKNSDPVLSSTSADQGGETKGEAESVAKTGYNSDHTPK